MCLGPLDLKCPLRVCDGSLDPVVASAGRTGWQGSAPQPLALGYLVYIGEVVAPLLMLFGVFTRAAALVVVGNMIVALLLVHTSQFFSINETGGWALELQGMYLGAAIAVALLGAGRYSIGGTAGRFN
jgi:putative oxidoreductase